MKEQSIAKVYAQSLLELGEEKKVDVACELIKLTEVINSSNDLENVLFLDVFTPEEKKTVFNDVSKKLKISPLSKGVVSFLIEEKRINLLPLIVKEVTVIDDAKNGFIRGTVEGTDKDISKNDLEIIKAYLKQRVSKEPILEYKKNENITAGFKVTLDDLQLDASLDTQLEHFKQTVIGE